MSAEKVDKKDGLKTLLKRLRVEREDLVHGAREQQKTRNAVRRKVKKALANGPKTVPELAAAAGIGTDEALWHLTAMKKYGAVVEGELEESYPRYRLVQEEGEEQ